jgi:hypothetical protein
MTGKTLTVVLCQSREFEHTYHSLEKMVLGPLQSDLAFCGSHTPVPGNMIETVVQHYWHHEEPNDWVEAINGISQIDYSWRPLLDLDPAFLGGTGLGDSVGSGAIIMYWREILRGHITERILNEYEWFVITRSDFLWLTPHPEVGSLNSEEIYFLDGEQYGGISDRHIIFHRKFAPEIFGIASPIFQNSDQLLAQLSRIEGHLNPEVFLKFRFETMNLAKNIRFLPYLGFTIRHEGTETRWSQGEFSPKHGLYLKYPLEFEKARRIALIMRKAEHWDTWLQGAFSPRVLAVKILLRTISPQRRISIWIKTRLSKLGRKRSSFP